MNRIVSHLRGNAVAYLALFVALGGTSYAVAVPANSVGTRQIRNHAITPDQAGSEDDRGVGASVGRHSERDEGGRVAAEGAGGVWDPTFAAGVVSWGSAVSKSCFPLASGGGTRPGVSLWPTSRDRRRRTFGPSLTRGSTATARPLCRSSSCSARVSEFEALDETEVPSAAH